MILVLQISMEGMTFFLDITDAIAQKSNI